MTRTEQFQEELFALLRKHDAEMTELDKLKEEFNTLISKDMTVGQRYTAEGQAVIDRICEIRDLLNLWNGEMTAK